MVAAGEGGWSHNTIAAPGIIGEQIPRPFPVRCGILMVANRVMEAAGMWAVGWLLKAKIGGP